ncbi:MAG: hypothetical protein LBE07_02105 [Gordonia sp. (in: high G+C Gram-positive bacteria)]|jgi:Mce-associated membrane protein|nr:hypothetical protein [Gordonia sp. (in: high G+C Gram-positive bacteria)]
MAAGGNKPRRTPKVAGRATSKVEVSEVGVAKRAAATGSTTASVGVSGVERKRQRVEDARSEAEAKRAASDVEPSARGTDSTYRLAAVLAGAAAVVAAVAVLFALHPGADVSDNKAFVDQGRTEQVLAGTRDAACVPFQYDYRTLDKWLGRVGDYLTGSSLELFQTNLKTSRELITQTKSSSDCRVDAVGLSEMSRDSATAIANLVVSTNQNGAITDSQFPQVRIVMQRDGDHWKAADFLDP